MIRADTEYHSNPTLGRLCETVAGIMHTWERLTAETNRMGGHVPSASSKPRENTATPAASTGATTGGDCEGCNRPNHSRDFNKDGPWAGSSVERTIRVWDTQPDVRLPWTQRADGTPWNGSAEAPNPKSRDKDYYGSDRGNSDGDRRGNDGGGKDGSSRVQFDDRSRGTPCRTGTVTHLTCNCGGSDIKSTYRQCLVSLATSSTYFTALTLFDTGARHTLSTGK